MAYKDPRYLAVKWLLKKKDITTFKQIFDHIPYTVVAADLHTNNDRMKRLIENPEQFRIEELYALADFIGYDSKKFVLFVMKDRYGPKD
jgi:hypothetical protein